MPNQRLVGLYRCKQHDAHFAGANAVMPCMRQATLVTCNMSGSSIYYHQFTVQLCLQGHFTAVLLPRTNTEDLSGKDPTYT